jgi:hypothetical protein
MNSLAKEKMGSILLFFLFSLANFGFVKVGNVSENVGGATSGCIARNRRGPYTYSNICSWLLGSFLVLNGFDDLSLGSQNNARGLPLSKEDPNFRYSLEILWCASKASRWEVNQITKSYKSSESNQLPRRVAAGGLEDDQECGCRVW